MEADADDEITISRRRATRLKLTTVGDQCHSGQLP